MKQNTKRNMKRKKQKKTSYFIPIAIAILSLVLYLVFQYSNGFYRLVAIYLAVTVDLPILATYLTNLSAKVGK